MSFLITKIEDGWLLKGAPSTFDPARDAGTISHDIMDHALWNDLDGDMASEARAVGRIVLNHVRSDELRYAETIGNIFLNELRRTWLPQKPSIEHPKSRVVWRKTDRNYHDAERIFNFAHLHLTAHEHLVQSPHWSWEPGEFHEFCLAWTAWQMHGYLQAARAYRKAGVPPIWVQSVRQNMVLAFRDILRREDDYEQVEVILSRRLNGSVLARGEGREDRYAI